MTEQKPTITFHDELQTAVSPDAVYAVLSDLPTHLTWAGKESPNKSFHLLTLDAPAGPATRGTTFSSSGANSTNGSMTFRDTSVVVVADPGKAFGFDTESTLERKRAKTWYGHVEHRYTITPSGDGSIITYNCDVFAKNYEAYWMKPWMRPMTRAMVNRRHAKHMKNLARMAAQVRVS